MPSHLHRWDEPGHIHFWTLSCYRRLQFFHDDGMKHVAIEALRSLQLQLGLCLIGYAIMPEHLHVLIYPHRRGEDSPTPIADALHRYKQYLGVHGKQRLREVWRQQGQLWSAPLNRWAHGEMGEREIMSTRGYDRNLFTREEFEEKLRYCHKNPVTRGLVASAEQWKWSSYRFYEYGDRSLLALDWDGSWPIVW